MNLRLNQAVMRTALVLAALIGPALSAANAQSPEQACYAAIRAMDTTSNALAPCRQAIARDSGLDQLGQARLQSAMAWYYARRGSDDASLEAVAQLPADVLDDPVVLNNLGNTYLALQQFARALQEYDNALGQSRDVSEQAAIQLNRSLVLRAMGRYEEAHAAYSTSQMLLNPAEQQLGREINYEFKQQFNQELNQEKLLETPDAGAAPDPLTPRS